ncbi:hypothetical protein K402DRAFT_4735 [Aulographum hederae CBS 113979]|uniref:Uncharacterized protein n=1 Tax=Aulographum hederae CBS 113979 TaxID=1176131 RepID=A0A6G1HHE0_9PEZI|nr:hypothetical protein K402DRAFT_4735 [Aulographum hederae CBS 113979]
MHAPGLGMVGMVGISRQGWKLRMGVVAWADGSAPASSILQRSKSKLINSTRLTNSSTQQLRPLRVRNTPTVQRPLLLTATRATSILFQAGPTHPHRIPPLLDPYRSMADRVRPWIPASRIPTFAALFFPSFPLLKALRCSSARLPEASHTTILGDEPTTPAPTSSQLGIL